MSYGYHRIGSGPDRVDRYRSALLAESGYVPAPVPAPAVITVAAVPDSADRSAAVVASFDEGIFSAGPKVKLSANAARSLGYTGNTCTQCGSARMKISGHCEVCEDCGSSSGCS